MKQLKVFLITLSVNSILLPWYATTGWDLESMLHLMLIGIREMGGFTGYAIIVFYGMERISALQGKKRWIVVRIFFLFVIVLLTQFLWSFIIHKGDYSLIQFVEFWGFYFLWTLLTCIAIPLLDRWYSSGKLVPKKI